MLWVPVLLASGIGAYFALPEEPHLYQPMRLLALLMAMLLFARRRQWLRLVCYAAIIANIGFLAAYTRTHRIENPVYSGGQFMRSVVGVVDDIRLKEKGQKLILKNPEIEELAANETPQRISITLRKQYPEIKVGDRVQLKAMLFPPPGPALPGGYDFARAFYFERIGAVGFSPSPPSVLAKGEISEFDQWLAGVRLAIAERISAPMSEQNAPVATAMMVGEQTAVSKEVSDALRDAGLYHVLSISGLHLSIAAGLLYFSVRLLLAMWPSLAMRVPAKKIAAGLGLLGAFAYLMLAGYPVPAIRSFVMVACVMLAVIFDRRGISLYSLAWAATIILLWQPESLMSASFQLSFAATISILVFFERFSHLIYDSEAGWLRKIWLYFFGLMLTSLAATLATTPLVIYHFNRFTLWGIAANMLMIPLASFWIMPALVIAFFAMPFGLEYWPLQLLDYGIGLMVNGSKWIAQFPLASLSLRSPTGWGIVLAVYAALWLCIWKQRWRLIGVPFIIIGVATMLMYVPYDLVISADGRRVAVRLDDDRFLFLRGKPGSFDGQSWLRSQGFNEGLTHKDIKNDDDAPVCDEIKCIVSINQFEVAVARHKNKTEGLCDRNVDVVVSQDALEDAMCNRIPLVIDQKFLRANGAVAMRFMHTGVQIDTTKELRGNRPWTPKLLEALPNDE